MRLQRSASKIEAGPSPMYRVAEINRYVCICLTVYLRSISGLPVVEKESPPYCATIFGFGYTYVRLNVVALDLEVCPSTYRVLIVTSINSVRTYSSDGPWLSFLYLADCKSDTGDRDQ